MSLKLVPINNSHTGGGAMDWDIFGTSNTLPDSVWIESIYVVFATSPTQDKLKLTYTPPSGVETIVMAANPYTGADAEEKQNIVLSVNRRFSTGGVLSLQFANNDSVATISCTVEYDSNPNL